MVIESIAAGAVATLTALGGGVLMVRRASNEGQSRKNRVQIVSRRNQPTPEMTEHLVPGDNNILRRV